MALKQNEEEASMVAVCIWMTTPTVWPPNYAIQNVWFTASIERLRYPGSGWRVRWYTRTRTRKSGNDLALKKSKVFRRVKTDQRMVTFAVEVRIKLLKTLTSVCALFIWVRCWKFLLFKWPTNSKQKTPVSVCLLRVDLGLPRGNG
jgi:hypothetical protein